jgi:hypothetical protein
VVGEIYAGTIAIASQIWGPGSAQVEAAKQLREDIQASNWSVTAKAGFVIRQCHGVLRSYASDIKGGRLGSLRLEFQGQVFADFVNAAKTAMSEGSKDVAAVLAAAALEDTLKRYGEAKNLDVDDRDLQTVINTLRSAGLLSAPQGALLKGMVPFRNKALHAEIGFLKGGHRLGVGIPAHGRLGEAGAILHRLVPRFGLPVMAAERRVVRFLALRGARLERLGQEPVKHLATNRQEPLVGHFPHPIVVELEPLADAP